METGEWWVERPPPHPLEHDRSSLGVRHDQSEIEGRHIPQDGLVRSWRTDLSLVVRYESSLGVDENFGVAKVGDQAGSRRLPSLPGVVGSRGTALAPLYMAHDKLGEAVGVRHRGKHSGRRTPGKRMVQKQQHEDRQTFWTTLIRHGDVSCQD